MTFTPGQVSEMLDIPGSTIRLYARLFAEHLSPQTGRKQRLYTDKDILIFARIKELRRQHTPIEAIGPLLQVEPQEPAKPKDSVFSLIPSVAAEIERAETAARTALARVDEQAAQIAELKEKFERFEKYFSLPWWKRIFKRPPMRG